MLNRKFLFLFLWMVSFFHVLDAQDKSTIKFGKITPADFNLNAGKFDSGANAVIIADIGSTSFEGNGNSGFTMIFTRFMRVKIMNKNGFDIAESRIHLYHESDGDAEKLTKIKGTTYNLENGVIQETKLDEKSIYNEKLDKNHDIKKFTMPGLKPGSLYELEYTIKSDYFFELRSWSFQGGYPRLWSEYQVTIPPQFHYVMSQKGDLHFDISTKKEVFEIYTIRENHGTSSDEVYHLDGNSIQLRWVKKDVPGLKEEPFTTTIDNYMSEISFQLHYFQWTETSDRHNFYVSWNEACKKLLSREDFGLALNYDNHWMADELKNITRGAVSSEEKARKIYAFVRDNFTCTDHDSKYARSSLKEVFKNHSGNVAEINLLLTAMLRHEGIGADPMILSTRDNGFTIQTYPLMGQFNYVVCVVRIKDKQILLDASQPYCGFGNLVESCYNGYGRIVNEENPYLVNISPDSIRESEMTNVLIINDEKGKLTGSYTSTLGWNGSYDLREEIKKVNEKEYFKKIQTRYGSDYSLENFSVDSISKLDYPVTIHYDFDIKNSSSPDIIYFDPLLHDQYTTNPFKSMERHYPVEMPYRLDEMYTLNMEIPNGYQVDEIPKSAKVALNENDGIFEYLIQKGPTNIQMRVHLKLNKAFFPTDDYATLRDFFGYIVKKESEQIVFKKTK